MTRPGIEPRSPGPLANTLAARPIKQFNLEYVNNVKWFQVLLCITNNSIKHQSFVYTQLIDQTVQFLIIQVSISTVKISDSSIWLIDGTLSSATTQGQSGPGRNNNEEVLRIPQSSSVIGASPLDCLLSYPRRLLGESYPSAEMQSVYFAAPVDGAIYMYINEVQKNSQLSRVY